MSLHIESTENALAELKKQRTKTLTAAISVSFLGIALMGLLLYLVHIIVAVPEDPPMVAYATQEGDNPDIDTPEVTQTTQRPSSSSTSAQVKVIAAVATADVAVVNPDIEVDVPSISNLEKVVVKAVDRIIDAQCPNGGWGYSYNNKINPDIDLSVTGWNVQALKAAEHGGIKPTKGEIRSTLRKASSYVRKNVMPDGKFSYKENGNMPRSSLVGVGVLSLQMTGNGSDSAARKGLDWIKNNVKNLQWGQGSGTENVKSNLYMHYYCVQAAMNRGGDVWTSYNKAFRDAVLSGQNADGSFRKNDVGYVSGMSNKSENIYRQCLATLMLETYYRFLPGTGEGTKNS